MTTPRKPRGPAWTATICVAVVVGMVGMSYAAVPLYRIFCAVTGYGGTTQRAEANGGEVLDREIVVRLDANVARDLPWSVTPEERRVRVRIGETRQTAYLAENVAGRDTVGTASFNVSPPQAGAYFNKIECFCFTEQSLAAGESAEMGVVFFVDPAFVEDEDTRGLTEITLSYTFFPDETDPGPAAGGGEAAALSAPVAGRLAAAGGLATAADSN